MSSVKKRPKIDQFGRTETMNRSLRKKNRKRRLLDTHVGIQDKLEREIKLRDGASRMLLACTHEDQLLEVAKTLHTSNARMYNYMTVLQKLKTAEIMEKVMDEEGTQNESKVCTGRVAISDIRIPLMWNDPERFSGAKVKEASRYAVFCLVRVGGEVQDTELICMDKTTTDLSFRDILVFEDSTYNFKMDLEIYAFPMSEEPISAPTPQKLLSRLNRSIGKSEGKRIRDRINQTPSSNMKIGPQYEKLGSLTLDLTSVDDHIRSHDITKVTSPTCSSNRSKPLLPLYGNLSCRLVAQPKCITDKCITGFLHFMEVGNGPPSWCYMWCEVKAGKLQCWQNPEDTASRHPQRSIDLIGLDVKINEIERNRQKRPNSFQVRDLVNRYMFSASSKEDMTRWIKDLRQHRGDYAAWSTACIPEKDGAQPMFIGSPSPCKAPTQLLFDPSVRRTFIYDQLSMESPTSGDSDVVEISDLLKNVAQTPPTDFASESNQSTPWAGLFNGALTRSVTKVTKLKDVQNAEPSQSVKKSLRSRTKSNDGIFSSLRSSRGKGSSQKPPVPHRPSEESLKDRKKLYVKPLTSTIPIPKIEDLKSCNTSESCSETALSDLCQSSDDVFLSSDDNLLNSPSRKKKSSDKSKGKKKRRAPLPPTPTQELKVGYSQANSATRSRSKASLSSASSLDDILDSKTEPRKPPRSYAANRVPYTKASGIYTQSSDQDERKSQLSLASNSTQVSNTSSGYKSDSEGLAAVSISPPISHSKLYSQYDRHDYAEIEVCEQDGKLKMKAKTGVKVLPTELPTGVKLTPNKSSRSHSYDSDSVLRDNNRLDVENNPEGEIIRPRFGSIPARPTPVKSSRSTPISAVKKKDKLVMQMLKPTPTPRRSYLTAVESSKVSSHSVPIYDEPANLQSTESKNHNVEDLYSVPIPKTLRPSTKANRVEDPEPIYATVEKSRKTKTNQNNYQATPEKIGVDAYAKAHKAIITVCKQRMEEEEQARKRSEEETFYV